MELSRNSNSFRIGPDSTDAAILRKTAGIVAGGGTAVVPTLGVYGLAVDALNRAAVKKVFRLKQRPADKPLSVLLGAKEQLQQVTVKPDPLTLALMDEFWPGGVTFVVPAGNRLPPDLLAGGKTVGIRLVAHPVTAALVRLMGRPLTGTSANVSGQVPPSRIEDLNPVLARKVDVILDAGPLAAGGPSTVVAVEGGKVRIIRPGRVPDSVIHEVASRLRKLG